jgi:hypothetical protein
VAHLRGVKVFSTHLEIVETIMTIAVRRHDSKDIANFPHIDAPGVGALTVDDQTCLNELGECLVSKAAHDRFGVILLHSHFPIEEGETIFEEPLADERLVKVKPIRNAHPDLVPVNFRFDDDTFSSEPRLVGLHYLASGQLKGVRPVNDGDRTILSQLREVLSAHDKMERFGLRLLHEPFGREVSLLETCDMDGRVLTCRVVDDETALDGSIATLFKWYQRRVENGPNVNEQYISFCKGVTGCAKVGDSHISKSSHDTVHGTGPR